MDMNETFDRLVPEPDVAPDWAGVLADALPPSRARVGLKLTLGGAAVAVLLLLVVAPWRGSERISGRVGVLDAAAAALGEGQVVHLVLDEQWGGTVVDMKTGKSTPLIARRDVWYDPARGLHEYSSLGGVVESDDLFAKDEVPASRAKKWGLVLRFREALDSGEARVVGSGTVAGIPVDWISVSRSEFEMDGTKHETSQDVAVSKETHKPVYFRETVDGKQSSSVSSLVLQVQLLPAGEGDFTKEQRSDVYTGPVNGVDDPGKPLSTEEASKRLGGKGLWLGPSFGNVAANLRTFDLSWAGTQIEGLRAIYGGVYIYETDRLHSSMEAAPIPYVPPEGKLFIVDGGSTVLQRDGIYVVLAAPSGKLLEVAKALRPISAGSAAGG